MGICNEKDKKICLRLSHKQKYYIRKFNTFFGLYTAIGGNKRDKDIENGISTSITRMWPLIKK